MAGSRNFFPWLIFGTFLAMAVTKNGAEWQDAQATFYGDMAGGETIAGACGYSDVFKQGYGLDTAALSTALFNNGTICGACFEIVCANKNPEWCIKGGGPIRITATNFCPPNYSKPHDNWCNPPQKHFDLSMPMFLKLVTEAKVGLTHVKYRRVPCHKQGGVKFDIEGNPHWLLVLVYNVGGAGDGVDMKIKGSKTVWLPMIRNWGQKWQTGENLMGQRLSFQVTTSDNKMVQFDDVTPSYWHFGQTYEAKKNI